MVYDPEQQYLSGTALQQFQVLWANNGDAISRQYTGTDALKVMTAIVMQIGNDYCISIVSVCIQWNIFIMYPCGLYLPLLIISIVGVFLFKIVTIIMFTFL